MLKTARISSAGSREPQEVDLHVGERMRLLRAERGMSQSELAAAAGVTYQQLQKYEWGRNRVSASRLYAISQILGADVSYFFEGLDDSQSGDTSDTVRHGNTAETLALMRAYFGMPKELRPRFVAAMRALAQAFQSDEGSHE